LLHIEHNDKYWQYFQSTATKQSFTFSLDDLIKADKKAEKRKNAFPNKGLNKRKNAQGVPKSFSQVARTTGGKMKKIAGFKNISKSIQKRPQAVIKRKAAQVRQRALKRFKPLSKGDNSSRVLKTAINAINPWKQEKN